MHSGSPFTEEPVAAPATRHLTRNLRERCVMARIQRDGRMHYRCFAVSRYAGWESAEAAARLWLRSVRVQLAALAPREKSLSARNRSGVAGIFLHHTLHRLKSGRLASYPGYVARWPGSPVGSKWMFTNSGGEEGAFLRACLARELRTVDRCRIDWAALTLSPDKRATLLALRRPPGSSEAQSTPAIPVAAA